MAVNSPSPFHRLLALEHGLTSSELADLTEEEALHRWSPRAHAALVGLRSFLELPDSDGDPEVHEVVRSVARLLGPEALGAIFIRNGLNVWSAQTQLYRAIGPVRKTPSGESPSAFLDTLTFELMRAPGRLKED